MPDLTDRLPPDGIWRLKITLDGIEIAPAAPRSTTPLALAIYPYPVEGDRRRHKWLDRTEWMAVEQWAKGRGFDDAITLDRKGHLLESSKASLLWEFDGKRFKPDPALPLLPGVTVSVFDAGPVCVAELPRGAHLFVCSSIAGVRPVKRLGMRELPLDLELAARLREELERAEQRSEEDKSHKENR